MPEILVDSLSRDQIAHLHAVLDVFGEPTLAEEVAPIVVVLEAARLYYQRRQQILRMEERGG